VAIAIGSTCVMTAMESTGMQELLLLMLFLILYSEVIVINLFSLINYLLLVCFYMTDGLQKMLCCSLLFLLLL